MGKTILAQSGRCAAGRGWFFLLLGGGCFCAEVDTSQSCPAGNPAPLKGSQGGSQGRKGKLIPFSGSPLTSGLFLALPLGELAKSLILTERECKADRQHTVNGVPRQARAPERQYKSPRQKLDKMRIGGGVMSYECCHCAEKAKKSQSGLDFQRTCRFILLVRQMTNP